MTMQLPKEVRVNLSRQPKSEAQEIASAMLRGELTEKGAGQHMALLISRTLHDHPVRSYPQMSAQLSTYIADRRVGVIQRDPVLAVKNGEWLQMTFRIFQLNKNDLELLQWAKEHCREIKAEGPMRLIQVQIDKHTRNPFPRDTWDMATEVQIKDGEDRRREMRV